MSTMSLYILILFTLFTNMNQLPVINYLNGEYMTVYKLLRTYIFEV